MTEVLHPLDVELRESRATPLTSLKDNDTYGFLLVAQLLEECYKTTLGIVKTEGNHIARVLVLNLISTEKGELGVFTETYLENLKCEESA